MQEAAAANGATGAGRKRGKREGAADSDAIMDSVVKARDSNSRFASFTCIIVCGMLLHDRFRVSTHARQCIQHRRAAVIELSVLASHPESCKFNHATTALFRAIHIVAGSYMCCKPATGVLHTKGM